MRHADPNNWMLAGFRAQAAGTDFYTARSVLSCGHLKEALVHYEQGVKALEQAADALGFTLQAKAPQPVAEPSAAE